MNHHRATNNSRSETTFSSPSSTKPGHTLKPLRKYFPPRPRLSPADTGMGCNPIPTPDGRRPWSPLPPLHHNHHPNEKGYTVSPPLPKGKEGVQGGGIQGEWSRLEFVGEIHVRTSTQSCRAIEWQRRTRPVIRREQALRRTLRQRHTSPRTVQCGDDAAWRILNLKDDAQENSPR